MSEDARDLLRSIWDAQGQGELEPAADDCSPTRVCKNMKDVTFDGYAEPGSDLGAAWRAKLAREGKLDTEGGTVRDLIFGPPR